MDLVRAAVLACVVGAMSLGVAGCEKETGREVDPDVRLRGDSGLQSRDLREMTTRLAPDLRAEIGGNHPQKVVIVVKQITNNTVTYAGQDLSIYVQRLAGLLNKEPTVRNDIAFRAELKDLNRMRGEELGGGDQFGDVGRSEPGPDPTARPQYFLWGKFSEKREARSSYFLCEFYLTDVNTGIQTWSNMYEVKALNW